ncbi:MAG: histidine phosphatase family protein, partial [Actinobacteria bacterium]
MRLFLAARHGQSLFNVDKVVNGDPALDRGLSEQGVEEAERLAGQLAALPIGLVAVSPFPRALQTANIALAGRD